MKGGRGFMKFKPLADRVILEQESPETTTASGIVLPDSAQEKPQIGTVIAVGPGKVSEEGKAIPMNVKEGQKVVFAKYGGTELIEPDSNKTYMVVKESDLIAIYG